MAAAEENRNFALSGRCRRQCATAASARLGQRHKPFLAALALENDIGPIVADRPAGRETSSVARSPEP